VVGVFDHLAQAEQAVGDLWRLGFAHDRIDMVARGYGLTQASPNEHVQREAADAALTGAGAGAGAGAVAGALAIALIPGLGQVLGGGLLLGALGGAALGAAGGTFLGPFLALEIAEGDAHYFAQAVDEGRTVVLVHTTDRQNEARTILDRHGALQR
jgi:hypothetical protein